MNTEGKVKRYVKRIQNYQCEHRPPDVTKSLAFTTNFRSAARQKSDDVDIKLGRRNESAGEDEENLIFVRGIPVKVVGHKQNVRSSGDQSMTRFHHLKAQKAERTHQFYCGHKRKSLKLYNSMQIKKQTYSKTHHGLLCSYRNRQTRCQPSDVLQQTPKETRS